MRYINTWLLLLLPQAHLGVFQLCLWPLIAPGYLVINIQCRNKIWKIYPTQTPVLLSGSHLDRLLDERSVVSELHIKILWLGRTAPITMHPNTDLQISIKPDNGANIVRDICCTCHYKKRSPVTSLPTLSMTPMFLCRPTWARAFLPNCRPTFFEG